MHTYPSKGFFLVILILTLCYLLFFGEEGLLDFIKVKRELNRSLKRIAALEEENKRMRQEIDRLRNDNDYLEQIVRKRLGLIKEGEKVYKLEP